MKKYIEIAILILQGFTYKTAKQYLYYREKNKEKKCMYSTKQLMSILPFNKLFDKLFDDRLSVNYLLNEYDVLLPRYYYIFLKRNGSIALFDLSNNGRTASYKEVVDLLQREGAINIVKSKFNSNDKEYLCEYDNRNYFINHKTATEDELVDLLKMLTDDYLIVEAIKGDLKEITIINRNYEFPKIVNRKAPIDGRKENIELIAISIAKVFREIDYFNFTFIETRKGYVLTKVETGLDLLRKESFDKELIAFIDEKLTLRNQERRKTFRTIKKYIYSYYAQRKGFVDYMYKNWRKGKKEDRKTRSVPYLQMLWAHRKGFYSYRIKQYGLTKDNYNLFLSDYDYKRLRPLNNEYRKWLWDKLSFSYILKGYNNYLPEYYFLILKQDLKQVFLKKDRCPNSINSSLEGLVELIKYKRKLAFKPVVGSHGDGFLKVEYNGKSFFINDNQMDESEIYRFIKALDKNYIITEYLSVSQVLNRIYPHVVPTIRLMVINRNGIDPIIENAYLRIGTSSTGSTDNISRGGVFASIDEKTGCYSNAYIVEKHNIRKCTRHPDTDMKLEGKLPYWKHIQEKVLEISKYIFPLEYLGFDIVIIEGGFKILEINTHQDLHRYPEYNDAIKAYFFTKLLERR